MTNPIDTRKLSSLDIEAYNFIKEELQKIVNSIPDPSIPDYQNAAPLPNDLLNQLTQVRNLLEQVVQGRKVWAHIREVVHKHKQAN